MDGIFWAAAAGCPWRKLPARYGRPDTVGRHFRRLAAPGVWERLLYALAHPACPAPLRALEHWICRACRRASRVVGLRMVVPARRLGLISALRGPAWMLPDPDLSKAVHCTLELLFNRIEAGDLGPLVRARLRLCRRLLGVAGGRSRIPRHLEPA